MTAPSPYHEGSDRVELPGGWCLTHNGPSYNRRYWLNHPERGAIFHIDVGCYLSEFLEFAAALQAPARAPQGDGWRLFHDAPTNGDEVLAYRSDAGVFSAHFVSPSDFVDGCDTEPAWFTTRGEDLTGDLPTYFQPLPAPPADRANHGGKNAE